MHDSFVLYGMKVKALLPLEEFHPSQEPLDVVACLDRQILLSFLPFRQL